MNEFEMIAKYFAPLSLDGLRDDAAVVAVPAGHELVVSSDTLNEGVHFWDGAAPADIAHKALRANLSDLAAKGATPLCYQLNIAFPDAPREDWIAAFTAALKADQERFNIKLSGGDTTSIDCSISISITVMGVVPSGKAVRRFGARAGDHIIVTGAVGDAFIGLECLRGNLTPLDTAQFLNAYRRPTPACDIAGAVRDYARASLDVSDGLIADVGHMAKASGLRAVVRAHDVPISNTARALVDGGDVSLEALLSGGDDYVLACAVAPDDVDAFIKAARGAAFSPVVIGQFEEGAGVSVLDKGGAEMDLKQTGWSHF